MAKGASTGAKAAATNSGPNAEPPIPIERISVNFVSPEGLISPLEFYLDVSRMRFDEGFVKKMKPKFDQAFAEMDDLERGAIANPDENRMVGHYWLRNSDIAPTPETP